MPEIKAEVEIRLTGTPPVGFRWELIEGQKILKSGTAKSKKEAEAAAKVALAKHTDEASKYKKQK